MAAENRKEINLSSLVLHLSTPNLCIVNNRLSILEFLWFNMRKNRWMFVRRVGSTVSWGGHNMANKLHPKKAWMLWAITGKLSWYWPLFPVNCDMNCNDLRKPIRLSAEIKKLCGKWWHTVNKSTEILYCTINIGMTRNKRTLKIIFDTSMNQMCSCCGDSWAQTLFT